MKEKLFHPLEFMPANGLTVSHFVTPIHISHKMVIIRHNLQLYGFSTLIAESTVCWGIVNIRQHAYVCLVLPQYCHQIRPVLIQMSLLFTFVAVSGMPRLFGLTEPNSKCLLAKSSNISGEENKLSMCNLWPHACVFHPTSVTVPWVAVTRCALLCLSFPKYTFM
jgi:hypothetical protein